jgi:hypothetical protein
MMIITGGIAMVASVGVVGTVVIRRRRDCVVRCGFSIVRLRLRVLRRRIYTLPDISTVIITGKMRRENRLLVPRRFILFAQMVFMPIPPETMTTTTMTRMNRKHR